MGKRKPTDGHASALILFIISEQVCAPVDQIEQGEYKWECDSRDNIDSLRSGTFSIVRFLAI